MTYVIGEKPNPSSLSRDVLAKFAKVSTGTVGHVTDFGAAVGLIPLFRPCKAVGRALTVRLPQGDGSILHDAVGRIEPGDVLVIDTSGESKRAMWGGVVAYAASKAGVAGVVIDGPVTDWEELNEVRTPVWSRGMTTPLTGRRLGLEGQVNTAVQIAGVTVAPGDLVLADSDGVYVLTPSVAEELADRLVVREEREVLIKARIDQGEALGDIARSLKEPGSKGGAE